MIDFDDAGDFALLSIFFSGPIGIVLFIISVVFLIVAFSNQEECEDTKTCPSGEPPALIDGQCRCVQITEALDK